MSRVRHEPRLSLAALPQGDEHLIEPGGQARDLIVSADRDGAQIIGAGDAFHRPREPGDRRQTSTPHGGTRHRGQRDPRSTDQGEDDRESVQRRPCGPEVLREDQGGAVPDADSIDLFAPGGAQARLHLTAYDRDLRGADLERLTCGGAPSGRRDDLRVEVRVERPQRDERAPRLQGELRGELTVDQLVRLLLEPLVDALVQGSGHDEVGRDSHQGHRDPHRTRREQGHPLVQRDRGGFPPPRAHCHYGVFSYGVSRSTYPTPRTVWMSRTSPSPSVLRLR